MTFKEFIAAAKAKISAFYATKIGKIVIYGVIGTIIFLFGMTVGGATGCQMQMKKTESVKVQLEEKKAALKGLKVEIADLEKQNAAMEKVLTDKQKKKLQK
jgi:hypothetical protein